MRAARPVALSGLGLCLVAGLSGATLAKPGTPGPHYFAGTYERIGRAGGATAGGIDDRVTIVPLDQRVAIRSCDGAETLLAFGPAFEQENLMTGQSGAVAVECLFHNDGLNRPILTCRAGDGAAYTLWPLAGGEAGDPPACGG